MKVERNEELLNKILPAGLTIEDLSQEKLEELIIANNLKALIKNKKFASNQFDKWETHAVQFSFKYIQGSKVEEKKYDLADYVDEYGRLTCQFCKPEELEAFINSWHNIFKEEDTTDEAIDKMDEYLTQEFVDANTIVIVGDHFIKPLFVSL